MTPAPDPTANASTRSKRRVVLVTTYSANTGGGGAILRSLVPHLEGVHVRWLYLAGRDVGLPDSLWLGPTLQEWSLWRDTAGALRAWILGNHRLLRQYVRAICAEPADIFWIVGHNDGLLLAREVARKSDRPVHLTIHDDVPDGVFGRSRRYRWLQGAARRTLRQACAAASGVDVVSAGLQRYYRERYGVESGVILPYVPASNLVADGACPRGDEDDLLCGHIGSFYQLTEFIVFCRVFVEKARRANRRPRFLLIGSAPRTLEALGEFSEHIESHPILAEHDAVQRLARCHLVYAMYPFEARNTVFRRTSLPTKLSTYVQALRPVFAHTPADSTLSEAVSGFSVGKVCSTRSAAGIEAVLDAILHERWERAAFENLREAYYGFHNVRRMDEYLLAPTAPNPRSRPDRAA